MSVMMAPAACPQNQRPLALPTARLRPMARIAQWLDTARQRAALRQLDAAALDDIGLSEKQALAEARRPFWDAPDHWHN